MVEYVVVGLIGLVTGYLLRGLLQREAPKVEAEVKAAEAIVTKVEKDL